MKIFLRWFSLLAVVLAILGFTTLSVSAAASSLDSVVGFKTSANSSITEDEYWALVQSSWDAVDGLTGLSEEKVKESLATLAQEWEAITEVYVEGQIIPVDNQYLLRMLSADKPDLEKIAGLLDALLAAHKKYPEQAFSTADLTPLHTILSRPEFLWPEQAPNPLKEWFQKLWDSFNKWLNSIWGNEQIVIPFDTVMLSVFASIFLALILIYVFRTLWVDFMKEAHLNDTGEGGSEPLTSEAAFEKAQMLSRGGDYRSAVRYLYLSSLLLMDERGVLRYDRSKTNREYLRSVANSPELAKPLEEVIEVFDNVWYGYHPLEEESFKHYSDRVEELKEKRS